MHAARAEYRTAGASTREPFSWEWDNPRTVGECLQAAWNMTGRWQARRSVTVTRAQFDRRVLDVVPRLARRLNALGVTCLRDLARLDDRGYRRLAHVLHDAVADVSRIRATRRVEPVLGTKVLHHYFPSIVPVFDTALIRKGVMRTAPFQNFVDHDPEGWLAYADAADAGGPALLQFHRYFAFAAAQIASAPASALSKVRQTFGKAFSRLAPTVDVLRRDGLVWRMDAKIAEYCLLGQAQREGHFRKRRPFRSG